MAPFLALEGNLHDALLVRKYGLMAVSKVETPYLNVFVSGTSHDQLGIERDVHGEHGELRDEFHEVACRRRVRNFTLCP